MTDRNAMRGVLASRLALLGEPRQGEDPSLTERRHELEVRLAELGVDVAAEVRLPYGEDE